RSGGPGGSRSRRWSCWPRSRACRGVASWPSTCSGAGPAGGWGARPAGGSSGAGGAQPPNPALHPPAAARRVSRVEAPSAAAAGELYVRRRRHSERMTFEEAIPELFAVVPRFGARPDIPIAAEDYFTEVVARFDDRAALRQHLEELAPT